MGQPQKTVMETRRFVLADKFQTKGIHKVEKTESVFGKETPAVRRNVRDTDVVADSDLQASVKAILASVRD